MNERILGDDTFNHPKLIKLEWCLDLELIQSEYQLETMKGEPQNHHYQWL